MLNLLLFFRDKMAMRMRNTERKTEKQSMAILKTPQCQLVLFVLLPAVVFSCFFFFIYVHIKTERAMFFYIHRLYAIINVYI